MLSYNSLMVETDISFGMCETLEMNSSHIENTNQQVVLYVLMRKRNKTSKKVQKIVSQIHHLNLDLSDPCNVKMKNKYTSSKATSFLVLVLQSSSSKRSKPSHHNIARGK